MVIDFCRQPNYWKFGRFLIKNSSFDFIFGERWSTCVDTYI